MIAREGKDDEILGIPSPWISLLLIALGACTWVALGGWSLCVGGALFYDLLQWRRIPPTARFIVVALDLALALGLVPIVLSVLRSPQRDDLPSTP